jgi:hypothetical protein
MNCNELKELLSEGRPLNGAAMDHLVSCAACRAMVESITLPETDPGTERINHIERLITASLKPVRPLPSNRTLIWNLLALFTAFSLIAAIPVGYNGFHVLTPFQRLAYYTMIFLFAMGFSANTVQQMIPGSSRTANPRWLIVGCLLSLVLLVALLFQKFDLDRFVRLGIPCLRLGSICALIGGGLFWFVVRKGFFTSPIEASTTVGFFAGLAGVAVLALHCPIENPAHIIVWHLGAAVLGAFGGALAGIFQRGNAR